MTRGYLFMTHHDSVHVNSVYFSRFMMIHLMWVIMMTHSVLMSIIWYMGWKLFLWCTWDDWVTSGRSHTISGWIHLLGNCLKLHWTEVKANKILISEHDVILFANPFFACHVFPPFTLVVCRTGEINQKHNFLTSLYVFDNSNLIPPIRINFETSILKDFRNEPYRKPPLTANKNGVFLPEI